MSLFDIRLNEEGIKSIKQFTKLAKWILILTSVIVAISLLEAWTSFFLTLKQDYVGNKLILFHSRAYPFYMMIYGVLVYLQVHYYLKTGRQLSIAIDSNDKAGFNRSFLSLIRSSIFALMGLSLAFLMVLFRILVSAAAFYYW